MNEKKGRVFIVGAGPGDPGLITVKGLRCLEQADVVVYDRLANARLLSQAKEGAELIFAGKGPDKHVLEQDEINSVLVEKARAGKTVVRLHGGDPFVFGRGAEEAEALRAEGLEFEIVPGVPSAVAVPAYAGIPVTHRNAASFFTVITGREDPTKEWTRVPWDKLAERSGTLLVLMGVESLPETVRKLQGYGLPSSTPIALVQNGTTPRQRTVVGTLTDIVERVNEAKLTSPAVTIVGDVVRLREKLKWFDSKPLFGKRVLVTRSRAQASLLSEKLAELGAEPVELPTIEVAPPYDWSSLDNAIRDIHSFNWIIFTSANAVRMFFGRMKEKGWDSRSLAGAKICAIGPATAGELDSFGLKPDFVPGEFTSEGIVGSVGSMGMSGARVLLPRADIAPEGLVKGLRKLGATVEQVVAYRTLVPEDSKAKEVLARGDIDAATFTSSSTVKNLVELLDGHAPEMLNGVVIASIGPVTSETARSLGLRVDVEAKEHTIPGLVQALVGTMACRKGN